jgi:hypothetical protein
MEKARISIDNFKGISHLELEVKPFTVLIGPQSVGKSVTAKLLYYFQSVVGELFNAATGVSEGSLESRLLERFSKLLPEPTRKSGKSTVRYFVGENCMSLNHAGQADSGWQIALPEFLEEEFGKIRKEFSELGEPQTEDDLKKLGFVSMQAQERYRKRIHEKLGARATFTPRFIPAGRSFYAQVEKDAVSFFKSAALDPFVAGFGQYLARIKDFQFSRMGHPKMPEKSGLLAADLAESLLSGRYQREAQKDYISVQDGRKLPPALWSSGQQESLPLVFMLQKYSEGFLKSRTGTCLFIEEPEAHLFPASQRKIIELISLAFNSSEGALNLFVTTHSPYVLSTLNVLLKAGQVFQNKTSDAARAKASKIVPELEALAPDGLGAYYMDQRECRSILDEETGLIDGRAIDDVSGELAEQLDALIESQ